MSAVPVFARTGAARPTHAARTTVLAWAALEAFAACSTPHGRDAGVEQFDAPDELLLGLRDARAFDGDRDGVANDGARDAVPTLDVIEDSSLAPGAVDLSLVQPDAPPTAPMRFDDVDAPALAPTVIYPADGTVIPPNLPSFEVHLLPAPGTDLFCIEFVGRGGRLRVYSRGTAYGGGRVVTLGADTLLHIAGISQPGDGVRLRAFAVDSFGHLHGVGRSPSRDLGVTSTALRGAVYYWAAATGQILRYEFGIAEATPERMTITGTGECTGCHTLSRDGQRMALGQMLRNGIGLQMVDVPSRRQTGSSIFDAFFSTFSPDGSLALVNIGARLALVDGASGAALSGLSAELNGTMPDWSPDGQRIVFAAPRPGVTVDGLSHNGAADLKVLRWVDRASVGLPSMLVRSNGENNYYPSFAPDGRWVLFNRAGGSSYNNEGAHLWVVDGSPGPGVSPVPVALTSADGPGNLTNSWPRFAPFTQTFRGETLYWFTFSSRREYGVRLHLVDPNRPRPIAQLWMAAFLPSRVGSRDPSTPAFWLPFQSLESGNHIAQWATEVRRRACVTERDCDPGQRCLALSASRVCVGSP